MAKVIALWSASLDCDCPHCDECVDLLIAPDFWDGRRDLQIAEQGTPATTDMEVECPRCGKGFKVDCEW